MSVLKHKFQSVCFVVHILRIVVDESFRHPNDGLIQGSAK